MPWLACNSLVPRFPEARPPLTYTTCPSRRSHRRRCAQTYLILSGFIGAGLERVPANSLALRLGNSGRTANHSECWALDLRRHSCMSFSDAEITLALMPATQGVWPWPPDSPSCTALGREDELPFADASFDRIVLAHALECSPHPNRLLRECWRLIADDGTLIVIVPNRRGIWCWSDRTPFGSGQPFNSGQLRRLMHSHLFEIVQTRGAFVHAALACGLGQALRHYD